MAKDFSFDVESDFDASEMTNAVDQAQRAFGSETAHSVASGRVREANATGEPGNRKPELALACEAAMAQEVGVHHALGEPKAQARHEILFELLPEELRIGFMVFHGLGSKKS